MKNLKRYLKLYPHYLSMAIKSRLIYKIDWIIGICGFLFTNGASFFILYLTMLPVQSINGWSLQMIMFMYGFLLLPMGIDHIFTDALWDYGGYKIKDGEIDRIMMKPVNPLFQIVAEQFQYSGLGEVILGIAFMASFGPGLGITFTFSNATGLIIAGLLAVPIYFSIKLFTMSFAFFFKQSIALMSALYNTKDCAYYPLSMYNKAGTIGKIISNILLFILPFGLIGYLPISCLIFPNQEVNFLWFNIVPNIWLVDLSILVLGLTQCTVSCHFFKFGLKHYESSGS